MFNITFDFDEVTKKVTNVKVKSLTKLDNEKAIVQLMENKLKLTDKAIELLEVQSGDRITINYWTNNNRETFPLIGKSEVFTDKEGGTKLSKSNTISFRGNQNTILKTYGQLFELEVFKENMFKLVPINSEEDSIQEEQNELENLNSSDIDEDIKDIIDNVDTENDLPF